MPRQLKTRSRGLRRRDDDSASDPYSDELEGSTSPSILDTGEDLENERPGNSGSDIDDVDPQAKASVSGRKRKAPLDEVVLHKDGGEKKQKHSSKATEPDADEEAILQGLRRQLEMIKKGKQIGESQNSQRRPARLVHVEKRSEDVVKDASDEDSSNVNEAEEESENSDGSPEFDSAEEQRALLPDNKLDDANDGADSESDSDSDSDSSQPQHPTTRSTKRSSKHAPTSLSTTRPVSRKRTVIPSAALPSRRTQGDPRFLPTSGPYPSTTSSAHLSKAYSFISDYRATEIAALKRQLADKRHTARLSEHERTELRTELQRLQNKERAREHGEREAEVRRKHKEVEKDKVRAGEKGRVWHLKKGEVKRMAVEERFGGLNARGKQKAIERRRKRVEGKEKKKMPGQRRTAR